MEATVKNDTLETPKTTELRVTLRDIVESFNSLRDLSAHKGSAAFGFTIGIVIRAAQPFLQEYDKQLTALRDKHYTPKSKDKPREPKSDEDREAFEEQVKTLLDTPVTLIGVGRIPLSKLEAEKVPLDGSDGSALHWLIKGDVATLFED